MPMSTATAAKSGSHSLFLRQERRKVTCSSGEMLAIVASVVDRLNGELGDKIE